MARKSSGSSKIQPMIGGSTAVPANKQKVKPPKGLRGKKVDSKIIDPKGEKPRGGKRTGGTLNTLSGRSGIMSPPIQGGYS